MAAIPSHLKLTMLFYTERKSKIEVTVKRVNEQSDANLRYGNVKDPPPVPTVFDLNSSHSLLHRLRHPPSDSRRDSI